jgi:hypothetical protein
MLRQYEPRRSSSGVDAASASLAAAGDGDGALTSVAAAPVRGSSLGARDRSSSSFDPLRPVVQLGSCFSDRRPVV